MGEFHERGNILHIDGTRVFVRPEHIKAERDVAEQLERAWKCQIKPFGALSPIDWYVIKHSRMVGVIEVKCRSHKLGTYPTVFLNVRKWMNLTNGAMGLAVPAVFVVKYTDCLAWVPLTEVDATKHSIGGCFRIVKAPGDIEPMVEIPIGSMRRL